jgi:UDP-N-acetylglucosamine 2-epimerase (non-hydrolysing)
MQKSAMKIAIVLGTRPEIIKMSPIIRKLEAQCFDYFVIHTGQHYSYNMDKIFFEQLMLPEPEYALNIGSGTHAEETSKALVGIEKTLQDEKPGLVLVEGDTNTVLGGALAASKLMIGVGHVEAGLRSHNRKMPEEINRVMADHLSDYLFAPTSNARDNLLREGIDEKRIFVTGNTIVDAVYQNLGLAKENDRLLKFRPNDDDYFLATLHRQENVDEKVRLEAIIKGLELVSEEFGATIIYPIHPRTRKRLEQHNIPVNDHRISLVEPLDYLNFLRLESQAKLVLTDSGGVQEEACILKVPCVTLRDSTERPETLEVGANSIAGTKPTDILENVKKMLSKDREWNNPFGDGNASGRIVDIITS